MTRKHREHVQKKVIKRLCPNQATLTQLWYCYSVQTSNKMYSFSETLIIYLYGYLKMLSNSDTVHKLEACMCVCCVWGGSEKGNRGYSSLSLRTKSLYICSYVVLKSYTFGLSGAGPGSFTWDPVPKDRTSNPRLLWSGKKNKKQNKVKLHNISGINMRHRIH